MSKSQFIKCLDTGLESTREDAYYVPSIRKYFSSEQGYLLWKDNPKIHKEVNKNGKKVDPYYKRVVDFLVANSDFPKGIPFPTIVLARMRDNYKSMGYQALFLALTSKEKQIQYYMRVKTFKNYAGKMLYMLAMVKDDVPVEYNRLVKLNAVQICTENDDVDIELAPKKQKTKDIRAFLDD